MQRDKKKHFYLQLNDKLEETVKKINPFLGKLLDLKLKQYCKP